MKLLFVSPGKIDANLRELVLEYIKRANFFFKAELLEVKTSKFSQHLDKLTKTHKVYLLDEGGAQMTSREFADLIQNAELNSKDLCFVLGEDYGFSDDIKNKFSDKISLSRLTLQHDIAALVFAEALYRTGSILRNTNYHK